MQYKGTKKALPEIGRELRADVIVEGSTTHLQDRVRITAQLIDARADTHLWDQTYERDLSTVILGFPRQWFLRSCVWDSGNANGPWNCWSRAL